MHKRVLSILFILAAINFSIAQQIQSPKNFLGYEIGTKFTRHHKIVDYFKTIASSKKDMVLLQQYGNTNEGRELLVAIVSSKENLQKLESIRTNNLSLAGLATNSNASKNTPAIVWLSYNVHGNEPSSSEAAMQTLYELVSNENSLTKEWLKNTVVIIDPCLNPDGRDRYVNWYNQVVGNNSNADAQSREHNEPWPGGRSNHYNFDLNRDWAWQTQVETQQRIKLYNQWMPQIHVDFHEQYYNNPYYFAPAAEPFHEVITNWQRDFQTQIGKNHAKYFDEKGWLYFTKERFDLFYPSYGDTYPIYNGSIGMTYEQAGHSRGGLTVLTNEGDTLTLVDRVKHHVTTSLSTIETASNNAQKLIQEFAKFFEESIQAKNAKYKTYLITSDNFNKLKALQDLLLLNDIKVGNIENTIGKAFNYATQKEEDVQLKKYSIAVSALQSKSVLATVLLEPKSKLSDSATYDITAWSLPYAFGVDAYAFKEAKKVTTLQLSIVADKLEPTNYGFLIEYNSTQSAKALSYLLQQGLKVRYTEKPFTYKGKAYERGTLILIKKGNNVDAINKAAKDLATQFQVKVNTVETGFMDSGLDFGSSDIKLINAPKVLLLNGEGASSTATGEVWNYFDTQLKYPLTIINTTDFANANLKNYNTIILADGYYKLLTDKSQSDKLKDFVKSGGKIVALEGAVSQLANLDLGFKLKEDGSDKKDEKGDYGLLKKYADRERDYLPNSIPGAIYKVELDNTHPLAFGYSNTYYTLKQDANIYEFLKDGWNVGTIKKENYITGFSGNKVLNKLKDGTVIGSIEYGNGNIIFLAEDPLFRLFWENGKLLFNNAIFLVGN